MVYLPYSNFKTIKKCQTSDKAFFKLVHNGLFLEYQHIFFKVRLFNGLPEAVLFIEESDDDDNDPNERVSFTFESNETDFAGK